MMNRKIEYWIVPPVADGEFVGLMEEGLEAYERLYEPARPVLCMDEMPVQSLRESGVSIPATRQYGKRVDYEYERAGTANVFVFVELLAGGREVVVAIRKPRTSERGGRNGYSRP